MTTELLAVVQAIAAAVQAAASVMMLFALWVYVRQARATREATRAQNIRALFDLLFSTPTREALVHVRSELQGKPYETWNDKDKDAAGTVCSAYNLAALMADQKLVDQKLVVDHWASSIVKCHEILKPFLDDRRQTNRSTYWSGFTQLYNMAVRRAGTPELVLPGQ